MPKLMTTKEFLELPDDGVERWLVDGELREFGRVVRDRRRSRILIRVGQALANWLDQRPTPRGEILGKAFIHLPGPGTTAGIDVAYISPDVVAAQTDEATLIVGVPSLVVDVPSLHETCGSLHARIAVYRRAGIPLVWVINPYDETVIVHRLDVKVRGLNTDDDLSGEPELPGFRVPVARLFE